MIGVFGGLAKAPKHLLFTDNDARIFGMDEFGFGVIWDIIATSTPPTPLLRQYPGRQARILLESQDRAVDHDGRRLTVWGLADGEADLELGFWPSEIARIIVSPDERFLAVGLSSGEVAIIETASIGVEVTAGGFGQSPEVKTRFKAGEEPVEAVRFSADNTTVFVSNGQPQTGAWGSPDALSVSAWKVATGERLGSFGRINGLAAVSPDGEAFVVIEEDGIFRLRDTKTGSVRLTLPAMEGLSGDQLSHRSRFSTDGRLLLTTFAEPTRDRLNWRVWNVANDKLASEGSLVDVRFAEFSDDFSTLFALDQRSRRHVFAVSADTGKSLWRTLLPGQEDSFASFKLRDGSLEVAHGIDLYTVDIGMGTIESRRTLPFDASSGRTKSFVIQLTNVDDMVWSLEAFGGVSATKEGAFIAAVCDFDQGELLAGYRIFPGNANGRSGFANVPSSVAWDACEPHQKPRIVDRAFVVWDAVFDTFSGLADDAFEVVEEVL